MRLFGLFCLAMGLAGVSQAQTTTVHTNIHVVVLENHETEGRTSHVSSGQPIITTRAISPRAVRLLGDINIGVLGSEFALKSGDILFGRYDKSVWTYCSYTNLTAESRVASAITTGIITGGVSLLFEPTREDGNVVCLHDANADGLFETGWASLQQSAQDSPIAYSLNRKTMEGTIAYERVDPRLGPAMSYQITWSKPRNQGLLVFSTKLAGTQINKKVAAIPVPGEDPVQVEIGGLKLALHAYDDQRDELMLEVLNGFENFYLRIPATYTISYSYY
tara:strand:- start:14 stop:844 length:831 start_codon:yes stop_codon:yes gene_type:complete